MKSQNYCIGTPNIALNRTGRHAARCFVDVGAARRLA